MQCLGAPLQYLNKTALKEAFASYLKLPVENVCIDKILVIIHKIILYYILLFINAYIKVSWNMQVNEMAVYICDLFLYCGHFVVIPDT